jgi:predicted component of type VI protein secretion system
MKTMTCNQLGGACSEKFTAETFNEIADMSKRHGMEMFEKGDKAHLEAMNKMKTLMQQPNGIQEWFEEKRKQFEALPEN